MLPTPPTIVRRVTVSTAAELQTVMGLSGSEITFSGPGFVGTLSPRNDQRYIFPAGFTLTAPSDGFLLNLGSAQRVELVGTGGRGVGGTTAGSYSDLRMRGVDFRTRDNSGAIWLDQHYFTGGRRTLIESSYIYAYNYTVYWHGSSDFVIANSEIVQGAGNYALTRGGGSTTTLFIDSRFISPTGQQMLRVHEGQQRYGLWNNQIEGGTGVVSKAAGADPGVDCNDLVLLDNGLYLTGAPITAPYLEGSILNVPMATIVGNRAYTNWETGSQINIGTGPGWVVNNNPRSAQVVAPAWQRQ